MPARTCGGGEEEEACSVEWKDGSHFLQEDGRAFLESPLGSRLAIIGGQAGSRLGPLRMEDISLGPY